MAGINYILNGKLIVGSSVQDVNAAQNTALLHQAIMASVCSISRCQHAGQTGLSDFIFIFQCLPSLLLVIPHSHYSYSCSQNKFALIFVQPFSKTLSFFASLSGGP